MLPPVGVRDGYSKGQKDNDTSGLRKARTRLRTAPSRGASEPLSYEQNSLGPGPLMQHDQSSSGGEQASPPLQNPSHSFNTTASGAGMCSFFCSGRLHSWPTLLPLSPCKTLQSTGVNSLRLICLLLFPPPTTGGCKPRVAFYVYSSLLSTISLLPPFFGRGDVMALDLFTPDGFFNPSTTGFTIINSYSTKGHSNNTRSGTPDILFPFCPLPTLTLGDLNIHHPTADPLRVFKEDEITTSTPSFDTATDLGSLLNTPCVFTRISM